MTVTDITSSDNFFYRHTSASGTWKHQLITGTKHCNAGNLCTLSVIFCKVLVVSLFVVNDNIGYGFRLGLLPQFMGCSISAGSACRIQPLRCQHGILSDVSPMNIKVRLHDEYSNVGYVACALRVNLFLYTSKLSRSFGLQWSL